MPSQCGPSRPGSLSRWRARCRRPRALTATAPRDAVTARWAATQPIQMRSGPGQGRPGRAANCRPHHRLARQPGRPPAHPCARRCCTAWRTACAEPAGRQAQAARARLQLRSRRCLAAPSAAALPRRRRPGARAGGEAGTGAHSTVVRTRSRQHAAAHSTGYGGLAKTRPVTRACLCHQASLDSSAESSWRRFRAARQGSPLPPARHAQAPVRRLAVRKTWVKVK